MDLLFLIIYVEHCCAHEFIRCYCFFVFFPTDWTLDVHLKIFIYSSSNKELVLGKQEWQQ